MRCSAVRIITRSIARGVGLTAAIPDAPRAARTNRPSWLARALTWPRRHRPFLDIGTGLPTQGNVHQVARDVSPAARVVYVDNDPVVGPMRGHCWRTLQPSSRSKATCSTRATC